MRTDATRRGPRNKALVASLVGGLAALSPVAQADGPVPSPAALGITESVLQYCGPLDPTAAARLRQKIKELEQGASEQQLAEVRKSDEYRNAYDSVVDFVGKIDQHNAKRFCADTPVAPK